MSPGQNDPHAPTGRWPGSPWLLGATLMATCPDPTSSLMLSALRDASSTSAWRLLRDCPLSAIALDLEQRVLLWNPAAEQLFGWSEADILGEPLQLARHPDEHRELSDLHAAVIATGSTHLHEAQLVRRDGTWFGAALAVGPLRDADGKIQGTIGLVFDLSEHNRVERRLAELAGEIAAQAGILHAVLAALPDQLHLFDPDGHYLYISPAVALELDVDPHAVVGQTVFDIGIDASIAVELDANRKSVMATGYPCQHELAVDTAAGRRELECSLIPIPGTEGETTSVLATVRDITQRTSDSASLERAYVLLSQLVANTPLGVIEWGAHEQVRRWSPQAVRIFDWTEAETLGQRVDQLGLIHPDDARRTALANQTLIEGDILHNVVEQRNLTKDGRVRFCRWYNSIVRTRGGDDFTVLSLIEDVTERRAAQERIRHLAERDPLTALPNRALFHDRLDQAIARARRAGGQGALLLLDLDHFKDVNDTLGHQIGDRLLVETGRRLRRTVRQTDTVARLGGDEFALILPELDSTESASLVAAKVLQVLAHPVQLDGEELHGGASVGVTLFPGDSDDPEQLLKNADLALYHAKAKGRGAAALYTSDLSGGAHDRRTLIQELRQSVVDDGFELHYQPQIDLATGALAGVEALVRWQHPRFGLLTAQAFLDAALSSGLICSIGSLVLRRACHQAHLWRQEGLVVPRITVNLSAVECRQPDLAAQVLEIVTETGLPSACLELEVTEQVFQDGRPGTAPDGLIGLAQTGVSLALDGFGRGWASLKGLTHLPIRRVKFDPAFIADSVDDPNHRVVVEALIELAHRLELKVLGTGVETKMQREALAQLGFDEAQGYWFAPPLVASELTGLLRQL
jgi:diguanylate cyclase (GGDEF)-like protein/PAS domain S-box-containing protein